MSRRVVIADDDALARAALRTILDAHDDLDLVAEASDGLEAVEAAGRLLPDVVLLDIRMPNLDGLESARRILGSQSNRARVIMLTTFDLDEYIYDALKAGASGFLRKDAPPSDSSRSSAPPAIGTPCSIQRSPDGSSSGTCGQTRRASAGPASSPNSPRANGKSSSRSRVATATPK